MLRNCFSRISLHGHSLRLAMGKNLAQKDKKIIWKDYSIFIGNEAYPKMANFDFVDIIFLEKNDAFHYTHTLIFLVYYKLAERVFFRKCGRKNLNKVIHSGFTVSLIFHQRWNS